MCDGGLVASVERSGVLPIFILSLPRTGSTLLQRLLASDPRISTTSEPWLLLPWLHPLVSDGAGAEYSHQTLRIALQEMIDALPDGRQDYFDAVRQAGLHIYSQLSRPDSIYFLDKTPRYHLIAEQIFQTFPDAKFIVLWRNPLAVVASMLGFRPPWNLYDWYIDLYKGFENLYAFELAHCDGILSVRYEDLIQNKEETLGRIFNYLALDFQPVAYPMAEISNNSQLGDKKGLQKYSSQVSDASLDRWIAVLANPVRRSWSRRYLRFIGRERLSRIGYEMGAIERSLLSVPMSLRDAPLDLLKSGYGFLHTLLNLSVVKTKTDELIHARRIYPYS